MKIKPEGDRILIKIIKIQDQGVIKGGLVLPDSITFNGNAGVAEIIGLGKGYLSDKKNDDGTSIWEPLESKVGERIIFNSRAGLALSKKFRMIRESEILAKICDEGVDVGDELIGTENE